MTPPARPPIDDGEIGGGYHPDHYDPHQPFPPPPQRIGITRIAAAAGQDARDEARAAGATKREQAAAYSRAYNAAHPWIQARQNHQRQNRRWRRKHRAEIARLNPARRNPAPLQSAAQ